MRATLPFSAALALALALGCAKGAETASPSKYRAAEYQPLAVGNQWTYGGKMMGQLIEQTIEIKGVKDGYFYDNANGQLRVDSGGLRDPKRYLLAEPIERGKGWTSIVSVASTEHYEITDVGFDATVPAGAFRECIAVRGTNRIDKSREMTTEWTYAPGVGIIRIATSMKVGDKVMPQGTLELKSYKLAKK